MSTFTRETSLEPSFAAKFLELSWVIWSGVQMLPLAVVRWIEMPVPVLFGSRIFIEGMPVLVGVISALPLRASVVPGVEVPIPTLPELKTLKSVEVAVPAVVEPISKSVDAA